MIPLTSKHIIDKASMAAAKRFLGLTLSRVIHTIHDGKITAVVRWKWRGKTLRSLTIEYVKVSAICNDVDMTPLVFEIAVARENKELIAKTIRNLLYNQYREILAQPHRFIMSELSCVPVSRPKVTTQ